MVWDGDLQVIAVRVTKLLNVFIAKILIMREYD